MIAEEEGDTTDEWRLFKKWTEGTGSK